MRRRRTSLLLPLLIIAGVLWFLSSHPGYHGHTHAQAIAYATAHVGAAYLWGGTGPAFDCSGLIQQAYGWGANLRTSQQQWAGLRHVRHPVRGDLVFFHGVLQPGEQPPGHVGLVVGSHEMIDAYAPGYGVEYDSFGLPSSKPGLKDPTGYAAP